MDRRRMRRALVIAGNLFLVVAVLMGCSGGSDSTDDTTTTTGATEPAPNSEAASTSSLAPGKSKDAAPLGGINATALEDSKGDAMALVLSRSCDGGWGTGTAFAIDDQTLVTNWHVVTEDYEPDAPVDPRPWILTYKRGWRRGTVIGSSSSPDVAVIRLDDGSKMHATFSWADRDVRDGEYLAVMGYPAFNRGELQIAVGKSLDSNESYERPDPFDSIPAFGLKQELTPRTGPGTSGGPVVRADGKVAGIITWGYWDLRNWDAQDMSTVRPAIDKMVANPTEPTTACDADSKDRFGFSYTVRLGTSKFPNDALDRTDLLADSGPPGAKIITVDSDDYPPFLLSSYPYVTMAGPFTTLEEAETAKKMYQAKIDHSGEKDTFSVGVMPTEAFDYETGFQISSSCPDLTRSAVVVSGVTDSDPLKLRAVPSLNGEVLDELEAGEWLVLTETDPVDAEDVVWIQVGYFNGEEVTCGWVARRYTTAV